jgi:hypothetical protein
LVKLPMYVIGMIGGIGKTCAEQETIEGLQL